MKQPTLKSLKKEAETILMNKFNILTKHVLRLKSLDSKHLDNKIYQNTDILWR